MPKAFTETERVWIQERLLEAGHRQFAAAGLKKTSVEELAEAAGISKGAFYIFYESKEALFMAVAERAERQFREEVLATASLPGPSPRARLTAVLRRAFDLWKTIPILQIVTRGDFDILARKVSAETLQQHLRSDRIFVDQLINQCRCAGIPIQVSTEEIDGLLHALFFNSLHEDDLGAGALAPANGVLQELVAAFCLGEVTIEARHLIGHVAKPGERE